jgi:hypothetical protein
MKGKHNHTLAKLLTKLVYNHYVVPSQKETNQNGLPGGRIYLGSLDTDSWLP